MKKYLSLLLALAMVFALTACGSKNNIETPNVDEPAPENTEPVDVEIKFDKYDGAEEAEKHLGFTLDRTKVKGMDNPTVTGYKSDKLGYIEVKYSTPEADNVFGYKYNSDSIVHDFNESYPMVDTYTKDDVEVTVYGTSGFWSAAVWAKGDYVYAVNTTEVSEIEYDATIPPEEDVEPVEDEYADNEETVETVTPPLNDYSNNQIVIITLQKGKDLKDISSVLDENNFLVINSFDGYNVITAAAPEDVTSDENFAKYSQILEAVDVVMTVKRQSMDGISTENTPDVIMANGVSLDKIKEYVDMFWE